MIKKTKFGALKSLAVAGFVGACSVGVSQGAMITGSSLVGDPSMSWEAGANETIDGTSVDFDAVTGQGIVGVYNTGTTITTGDSVSITFDITRVNADTDIGFGFTDGVNVWGYQTYDLGSAPGVLEGAFGGLGATVPFSDPPGTSNTGIPAVGASGTLVMGFTFNAGTTDVTLGGTYYTGLAGASLSLSNGFVSGNNLSIIITTGGTNEDYQLNSIDSSVISAGGATTPEPTSALLASLGLGVFAFRRKRKTV